MKLQTITDENPVTSKIGFIISVYNLHPVLSSDDSNHFKCSTVSRMRLHRKSLLPINSIIIEGPECIQVLCVFSQYAASYGEILGMSTKSK